MPHIKFSTQVIEVEVEGNKAFATIVGSLPPACVISDIRIERNEYCSEVLINAEHRGTFDSFDAAVMHSVKRKVDLGEFSPGKYCVRINRKNNVITWFQIN